MPMPTRPSHSYRVIASVMRVWSCSPSGVARRLRSGIIEITSPVTSYSRSSVCTQQRIAVWYRSSS